MVFNNSRPVTTMRVIFRRAHWIRFLGVAAEGGRATSD
jgi:hypothetical protein